MYFKTPDSGHWVHHRRDFKGATFSCSRYCRVICGVTVALKSWQGCRAANNLKQCLNISILALILKHPSADAFCSGTPKISYRYNRIIKCVFLLQIII